MSIFVAVPYTRPFYGATIDSILFADKTDNFLWARLHGKAVDMARNALMLSFRDNYPEADYILFIDNDATFHPQAIRRLVSHDLPMVCGCMYTKDMPPQPTWGKFVGKTNEGKFIYRYGESTRRAILKMRENGLDHPDIKSNSICLPQTSNDLWEIDGCGFHFTLVRRDVVEALREPFFLDEDKDGAGEDFYFCRQVIEAGFPIYVDESVHTGHLINEDRAFGIKELMQWAWARGVSSESIEAEIVDVATYEV